MITHWTDIKTGDRLFKDTDFDNKGKNFFMKIVTWVISWFQNIKSGDIEDGDDHSETFVWVDEELHVASSTNKEGVRHKPFHRWVTQEGNPRIVIVRRRIPYSNRELELIYTMIMQDMGLPYALLSGAESLFGDPDDEIAHVESIIEDRGLICSETTAKWDIDKYDWPNMLPQELRELYLQNDASEIFDNKALNLFKL